MARSLTKKERDYIYNQLTMKLMDLDLYDSELESIKKLKIMAKLYRDTGMEFKGELKMPQNKIITYEFYRDHRRQTNVNISRNIKNPMTFFERTNIYNEIVDSLKKLNLWESKKERIIEFKKKALDYKTSGKGFIGELVLADGKKLVCELYNDYKHETIVKILGEEDLLSKFDRIRTYGEIVGGLKKLGVWESELDSICQLKQLAKEYKDNGTEAFGELALPDRQKIIYEFYKDKRKKTFVKISREQEDDTSSDSSSDSE